MGIFRYRSTKRTVLVLILLLFLVVSVISFLSYVVATNRLKYESTNTHMALLSQIDHKMELVLKSIDKETIQMFQTEDVQTFFDSDMNEQQSRVNAYRLSSYFTRFVNAEEYIYSIDLYSYVRKQLFSGSSLQEDQTPKDYDWIRQFASFDGYLKWLPTRKLSLNASNFPIYRNVVTLVRTYPLIHSPGYRRGAIAINIKEEALYQLLTDANNRSLGETFVLNPDGFVVSAADKNLLGQDMSGADVAARVRRGTEEGHFQMEVDGEKCSVFYVTSAYTGWKIVNVVPEIQLNKPLINVRNALTVIAVILFTAAGSLAVLIGLWTLNPVNRFVANLSKKLGTHPLYAGADWKQDNEFAVFENAVQDILTDSEQLQKQIKESKPIMKWRLLTEILTNYPAHYGKIGQYMELVGVQLHPNHFIVMSADFDGKPFAGSPRDLHLYAYALCNVAEEVMNAESKGAAMEWEDGQCAIILSFGDDDVGKHALRAVAVADMLKSFVREQFKQTITIGIGGEVQEMREIYQSHKQSLEALKYKLVLGNHSTIAWDDIQDYRTGSGKFRRLFAFTDSMVDTIKLLDEAKLQVQLRSWFDSLASTGVPPDIIKQLVVQLLMKAVVVAGEIGVEQEDLIPSQNVHEALEQHESLEQIRTFTTGLLTALIGGIRTRRNSREKNAAIENVLRFIRQHYMRADLSLNYLADEFRMNVSHLSKIFKDYTGTNFIDYLMELRIETSKEKLASGNVKIRDIAESVGYTNVNSFTRIFKKMTGLTPSEYREREWLNGENENTGTI
ncbi:helix-turn-helix domain-containing protein [Cohnella nanjingensis]|uniref:Helix-turn-helix domain-containing protein n=1 Tax=Cohnella nanjingensis TaxID=1387779 RepID=A0A7X0RUN3_9BACL|nr:helix-turn-helix domain-containing protein [Cohnella nanjingensis]MBB6672735.1 helix-turn-helix domain-containing protein [Cohnella nanjingensis]